METFNNCVLVCSFHLVCHFFVHGMGISNGNICMKAGIQIEMFHITPFLSEIIWILKCWLE